MTTPAFRGGVSAVAPRSQILIGCVCLLVGVAQSLGCGTGKEDGAASKEAPVATGSGSAPWNPGSLRTGASSKTQALPLFKVKASSEMKPWFDKANGITYRFMANHLLDGSLATAWHPKKRESKNMTAWFEVYLYGPSVLERIEIANGYQAPIVDRVAKYTDVDLFEANHRLSTARIRFSDGSEQVAVFGSDERGFVGIPVKTRAPVRWFRVEVMTIHKGSRFKDLAVSEVRAIGKGGSGDVAGPETPYAVGWQAIVGEGSDDWTIRLKLIVARNGALLKQVEVPPSEGRDSMSLIPGVDFYGRCEKADRRKGILCAGIDSSCGDFCYQDRLYVRVKESTTPRRLQLLQYVSCRGGVECPEEPKMLLDMPLEKGVKIVTPQ